MLKITLFVIFLLTGAYSSESDIKDIINRYKEKGIELRNQEGKIYFNAADNPVIIDEDLAYLSSLKNVISINLNNTSITNKGISYLLNMKELIRIDLGSTLITDSALSYISQLPNIEGLSLSSTRITNKSLDFIFKLKKLRALNLFGTDIVLENWPQINYSSIRLFSLYTPIQEIIGSDNIRDNILLWSTGKAPVKGQYLVGNADEAYLIQLDKGESWDPQNKDAILSEFRKK